MEEAMLLSEAILEEGMISGLINVVSRKMKRGETDKELEDYLLKMNSSNELDPNLAKKASPTERDAFVKFLSSSTIKRIINSNEVLKTQFNKIKAEISKPTGIPGEKDDSSQFEVNPEDAGKREKPAKVDPQAKQALSQLQSQWMKADSKQKAEIQREYMTNPYKKRIFTAAIKRGLISYKQ